MLSTANPASTDSFVAQNFAFDSAVASGIYVNSFVAHHVMGSAAETITLHKECTNIVSNTVKAIVDFLHSVSWKVFPKQLFKHSLKAPF
jgi:hypothetical protein